MVSITSVLDVIFPPVCPHCRREGAWLCVEAQKHISALPPLIDPLRIPGVEQVLVCGSYDAPVLAAIIQTLKFSGWSSLAPAISQLTHNLASHLPPNAVLIPVPLHFKRQRERGFNQARLIAQQLSHQTDLPVVPLLRRKHHTKQQAKLTEHERAANIAGAFGYDGASFAVPACGILVDDVITTGATIAECAAVLHAAGVQKILAVGLAKG